MEKQPAMKTKKTAVKIRFDAATMLKALESVVAALKPLTKAEKQAVLEMAEKAYKLDW